MDPTGTPTTVIVAEQQHTSHVKAYLRVFVALLLLTLAEYVYAKVLAGSSPVVLIGGLMLLAVAKAGLVGLFFMHLLFEGRWKYLVLIPTTFLAVVTVAALVPDIGFRQDPAADAALEPEAIDGTPANAESSSPG
jgi:cytochrome c oxidase subunit 4